MVMSSGSGELPIAPVSTTSDTHLVQAYRDGNEDAASQLHARYCRRLLSLARTCSSAELARRVDPEEIVQSVFRTFFRRVVENDYQVPEGFELWGLLLVIAMNKVREKGSYHRAAKRDVRKTVQVEGFETFVRARTGSVDVESDVSLLIRDAMELMPEAHRAVIGLRIEGYEVAEIADRMQRSKRSVERLLQDARRRLRSLLSIPEDS